MNERERFIAICKDEEVDYVPIFGFPGAPGMSRGAMKFTVDNLIKTGMPAEVADYGPPGSDKNVEAWKKYWGTCDPLTLDFSISGDEQGFKTESRIEGEYEIIESENGAIQRQVIDNDKTYSMPDYMVYPVRDRESWEFFKERVTPKKVMSDDEIEAACKQFDNRDKPLAINAGGTVGGVRSLMGPEAACITMYDDPELIAEMIAWKLEQAKKYAFPLIERLQPEIVTLWEDICGNAAMMVSPDHFDQFGGAYYREVADFCKAQNVDMTTVDSDGKVMELVPLLDSYGINCLHPFEAKGNNDLFKLREDHPDFIMMGWLEKEVVNEGNGDKIEAEIMSKVPALLKTGRYFPNGDHGLQPMVTFDNLCKFMTLLHEVCGSPKLGDFPRVSV